MIILRDVNTLQTIKVIPREYSTNTTYAVNITSDSENKNVYSHNFTDEFTLDKYWYQFSDFFTGLEENNFYTLSITRYQKEVFRGRIFCTNQSPISTFTVNSGEYTTTTSTNEFIFYEA